MIKIGIAGAYWGTSDVARPIIKDHHEAHQTECPADSISTNDDSDRPYLGCTQRTSETAIDPRAANKDHVTSPPCTREPKRLEEPQALSKAPSTAHHVCQGPTRAPREGPGFRCPVQSHWANLASSSCRSASDISSTYFALCPTV